MFVEFTLIPNSDGATSEGVVEGEYQWSAIDEFRLHRRRPSSPSTTITTLTNPTSPSSPTPGNRMVYHLIDCSRLPGEVERTALLLRTEMHIFSAD